ncbi:hypothetical protein CTEN210_02872 [Chaetoceros tenuissimus]|uniref:Methyltransferase FkbM domain-containing protein n=1 Tax=Chaetoceros tenuissimus TaxID=426638 RepID=A0AAD3H181_9STRA|nr:hypothetical protein CTEN210_02872 [Chaetoceros tenuissimus]
MVIYTKDIENLKKAYQKSDVFKIGSNNTLQKSNQSVLTKIKSKDDNVKRKENRNMNMDAEQSRTENENNTATAKETHTNTTQYPRTMVVQKTINKNPFAIQIYNSNDIVSNEIRRRGWEMSFIASLKNIFLQYSAKHNVPLSELTFLDIGANIGWFSLNMAALGVNVIAFEPMEQNYEMIKRSLEEQINIDNGVSGRVTLYEHGLGVKEETCFLYSGDINVGDGHIKCVASEEDLSIQKGYSIRQKVIVKRLDDVLTTEKVKSMNIIAAKLDCEGFEGNVLEGGMNVLLDGGILNILSEYQPSWIKEKGSGDGGDADLYLQRFKDAGYRVEKMGGAEVFLKKSEPMNKVLDQNITSTKQTTQYPRTMVVQKTINKNPFAIQIYNSKDIVSNQIRGSGWETGFINSLKIIFLQYSAKHNIPLSELTFLDIGANIGWFSLNMAALGVNVVAFEPMEQNYQMIKRSLEEQTNIDNGVSDRVTLYEHGLGVKEETCFLYSDDGNVGDGHIKCVASEEDLSIQKGYSIRQKVIVKRLDDVLTTEKVKSMNIIAAKLDCEGFEGNVLEGGMNVLLDGGILNILSEYQPSWIKEKGSGNGGDADLYLQRFKDAGYRVEKMGGAEVFLKKSEPMNKVLDQNITSTKQTTQYPRTMVVQKTINKNPFAIQIYNSKDIVSNQIRGSGWETGFINSLKIIFLQYSAKHNIPLSELTFLDIGANIGWFSLNMAALGVNVVAFEPMEQNYQMIKRSLEEQTNIDNGVSDRVTLYEHGLGVKEETCFLYSDDGNVGDGHIKCVASEEDLSIQKGYSIRQKVIVKRLDDVLTTEKVKSMNIIAAKLDCEGFEGNVLEGGMNVLLDGGILNILSEYQPSWIKEKGSGNGGDADLYLQRFKDAGYRVEKMGGAEVFLKKSEPMNKVLDQNITSTKQTTQYPRTMVVQKTINKNPFAIQIYNSKDIVSNQIRGSGWETGFINSLKNIFLQYSAKHNIPLSELTFLDIGANIGWFSLNMAALGVNVVAFEPMEQNYQMIKRSLEEQTNIDNGVSDRVTLYEHGLGVKEETCFLYSDDGNVGDGHIKCVANEEDLSIQKGYSIRQKVIVKRLDDVLTTEKVKSMNIIAAKLDCEGFEGNVLEGGMNVLLDGGILNILSEYQPSWIKEKGSGNGGDADLYLQRFKDAGYRVEKMGGAEVFLKKSDGL